MLSLYLQGIKNLFNFAKKALLVIVVFFAIISVFAYFINKDKPKITSDPIQKNREEIYKVINDPKLNSTKEGKTSIAIYKAIACGAIGEACTNNPADGNKNFKNSFFGFMSNLIVMPYANPPASGVYWAYSGLQNAGFVPKAYAAEGIGFGALKPFMNLWKVFRDISYMLLVLVLVAIGFMIMFRAKINPQTVISVENALPKIVISLLLITFSFAIAGFLIDLMYVVIAITISVMSNNNVYYDASKFQTEYLNADLGKLYLAIFPTKGTTWGWSGFNFLLDMGNAMLSLLGPWGNLLIRSLSGIAAFMFSLSPWVQNWLVPLSSVLNGILVAAFSLGNVPYALTWTFLTTLLSAVLTTIGVFFIPQFILGILIFITIIFLLIRIAFLLFKAYLQILLMIIFAPLFLLFEAVPGRSAFSFWFKNLVAEILTFPIVVALFLVGYIIVNSLAAPGSNIWSPPFLYGLDPNAFSVILGMGIIFMIPDLVKLAKELMGVKGLPVGFGPGTFFAGAGAGVGGALGLTGQFSSLMLAFPYLRTKIATLPLIGPLVREQRGAVTGAPPESAQPKPTPAPGTPGAAAGGGQTP